MCFWARRRRLRESTCSKKKKKRLTITPRHTWFSSLLHLLPSSSTASTLTSAMSPMFASLSLPLEAPRRCDACLPRSFARDPHPPHSCFHLCCVAAVCAAAPLPAAFVCSRLPPLYNLRGTGARRRAPPRLRGRGGRARCAGLGVGRRWWVARLAADCMIYHAGRGGCGSGAAGGFALRGRAEGGVQGRGSLLCVSRARRWAATIAARCYPRCRKSGRLFQRHACGASARGPRCGRASLL